MFRLYGIILFTVFSATLVGCCGPMECKPAKIGFKAYDPIVIALEKYNSENGKYPNSLPELTPKYIKEIPQSPSPPRPNNVEYIKENNHYVLSFKYGGPGFNTCKYRSIEKRWSCSGFY